MDWISINIYFEDPNDNDYSTMRQKDIKIWSQGWVLRESFICGNCRNRGCVIDVDFGHPLPKGCLCPDIKTKTKK